MLEFIVLGTIPGTSFQLTFNWVLGIGSILLVGTLLRMLDGRLMTNKQQSIDAVAL